MDFEVKLNVKYMYFKYFVHVKVQYSVLVQYSTLVYQYSTVKMVVG